MIDPRLRAFLAAQVGDRLEPVVAAGPALAEILRDFDGRTVALVGNARSLAERAEGEAIDAAGVVVRLNAAPLPSRRSHGARTDWLFASIRLERGLPAARAPTRIVWTNPRGRKLRWWLARDPRFAAVADAEFAHLRAALGARPSTGLKMLSLLERSGAARVRLHGFDFFASLSLSGDRTAAEVPHDFAAERAWVEALLARDPRFALGPQAESGIRVSASPASQEQPAGMASSLKS